MHDYQIPLELSSSSSVSSYATYILVGYYWSFTSDSGNHICRSAVFSGNLMSD